MSNPSINYEVWVHKAADTWHQILNGEDPHFAEKEEAEAKAEEVQEREDTHKVIVIERRMCAELHGPALLDQPPMISNSKKK